MQNDPLSTVQRSTLQLLGSHKVLEGFYLAGGTALALHLKHRSSEDFDFFTTEEFDVQKLQQEVVEQLSATHILTERQTVIVELHGVRLIKLEQGDDVADVAAVVSEEANGNSETHPAAQIEMKETPKKNGDKNGKNGKNEKKK